MINYSIVMRSVNANLFDINQAKARIKKAIEEGKQPQTADTELVKTEVQKAYAIAQYSEVMNIEKFARHISTHGCVYSRADISAILYLAVDCMREQLLTHTVDCHVEDGRDVCTGVHAAVAGDVACKLVHVHHVVILCDGKCILHFGFDELYIGLFWLFAFCLCCLDACFSLVDFKKVCVHATHYDTVVDHSFCVFLLVMLISLV